MVDQPLLSKYLTTPGVRNITFKVEGAEDGQGYQAPLKSKFGLVLI